MSTIEECPFCNPEDRVLIQNDLAQAFLSNPKITTGHFLITPKRHVEKPWELTNDEILNIFALINIVEQKLIETMAEGCDVRQNYKPFLKQNRVKVDHIHYHVIPRSNEDHLFQVSEKFGNQLWEEVSQKERTRFAELFK